MDATDFAIYRNLSADGQIRFWASRRIIDPRVSVREVADKVGLSEAGVRARLASLTDRGLLRGSAVTFNPSLFGAAVTVVEVPIANPRDSGRLFRDLPMIDGVLFARDLLDEQDRMVNVYVVADTAAATARRLSLLRRLAPEGLVRGPTPYWIPRCSRDLTALDWRLLATFRKDPDSTLTQFAATARLSAKTTRRRFELLLDSHACWWSHSSASEEWPLALVRVALTERVDPLAVAEEIAASVGTWMPVAADGLGLEPNRSTPLVAGLMSAERPAALEREVRKVLEVDGVTGVRRTFGLASETYPQWADEQVAARLASRH